MTIESDFVSPDHRLEQELIEVINRHIRASRAEREPLNPQVASHVLAIMATDVLKALAWQPQHVQAADRCLREAIKHLRSG